MSVRKIGVFLTALSLLLAGLLSTPGEAKAYGVATYTLNCPIYSVSGWTDYPMRNPVTGAYYVMESITNITRSQNFATSANVVIKGSTGNFTQTIDLSRISGLTFSPGDMIRIRIWDRYSGLLDITVPCGTSSGGGVSPSYLLRPIMCTTPILNGPGGPPVTYSDGSLFMVTAGTRRYVLPLGTLGPDGVRYHKIRGSYSVYGYIRIDCVA